MLVACSDNVCQSMKAGAGVFDEGMHPVNSGHCMMHPVLVFSLSAWRNTELSVLYRDVIHI